MLDVNMSVSEISDWLQTEDQTRLNTLYETADKIRRQRVGDEVWLRGLLEISNYCRRNCLYCGVRAARQTSRYRMTGDEILQRAQLAAEFGYGTVVIQSGEDTSLDAEFIADVVRNIKKRFSLAITLSLGERSENEWIAWKKAGADRYLLRFETSNPILYKALHPQPNDPNYPHRIVQLKRLREIGYEIGGGVMIGLPGQTFDDLANDLAVFRELDLDMIGNGPYLPHPNTPLGNLKRQNGFWRSSALNLAQSGITFSNKGEVDPYFCYPESEQQVPNTNDIAFKVVALTRILCPNANIPSTTAVATLDGASGRKNALERGANVVMPNITPEKYRALYEIYPNKAASHEEADATRRLALKQIAEIGRRVGVGPGASRSFIERASTDRGRSK